MTRITVQARAMGSYTSHGSSWMNNQQVWRRKLLGWGLLADWEREAACQDADITLFFGTERPLGDKGAWRTKSQTAQAKAICASCPVLDACRAWALKSRIPFGVVGGLTERERWAAIEGKPVGRGTRLIRPSG